MEIGAIPWRDLPRGNHSRHFEQSTGKPLYQRQLGSDRDLINFNFFLFFFLFSCCGLQEEARREGVVSLCCGRCNSALRMRRGRVVDAFCDESGTRRGRVGRRVVDALAMSEAGRVEDVSLTHRGHPPFSVDVMHSGTFQSPF